MVKELLPAKRDSAIARRLFEREARILADISHPHIPRLHAYFEEGGCFYLVQELIEGETLGNRLRRITRMSEQETRRVVFAILEVLEYLHARNPPVIHRDIKPDNIILTTAGAVCLIDFGAVREAVGGDDTHTSIGTPGYAPREQAAGHPRPASDLYALGATALEMLSGLSPVEWFDSVTGKPDWRGKVPCSDAFERIIARLFAELPQRFLSATEAKTALTQVNADASASDAATPPESAPLRNADRSIHAAAVVPPTRLADPYPTAQHASPSLPWRRIGLAVAAIAVIGIGTGQLFRSRPALDETLRGVPPTAVGEPRTQVDTTGRILPSGPERVPNAALSVPDSLPIGAGSKEPPGRNGLPPVTTAKIDTEGPPPTEGQRIPSVAPVSDSIRQVCARMLERVSLGERLTDEETKQLRTQCRQK